MISESPKDNALCPRCGFTLMDGCRFINVVERCKDKDRIPFPYMAVGESMHVECYIEHVIETYVEKVKHE